MLNTKHQDAVNDELSDTASSHADVQTLNAEPLPSYAEVSSSSGQHLPPEKTAPSHQRVQEPGQSTYPARGPTIADPFAFPIHELPSYPAANTIQKPLAIPQTSPSPAAPLLPGYPTALLSFGIPEDSWRSFIDTVSAFLSAKVSQQAIHHAADIASSIGDFHKQYALRTKEGFKNIGKSAKRFSPVGVIGNSIGITIGSVRHVVGTVFQAAGSLTLKPQTPRERASVYVATANKDWFSLRGLHAVLMDTHELASLCDVGVQGMLSAAHDCGSSSPGPQLAALRDVLGEIKVDERLLSGLAVDKPGDVSGKAAGKRPVAPHFQLGESTLWLVLVQKQDGAAPSGKTRG